MYHWKEINSLENFVLIWETNWCRMLLTHNFVSTKTMDFLYFRNYPLVFLRHCVKKKDIVSTKSNGILALFLWCKFHFGDCPFSHRLTAHQHQKFRCKPHNCNNQVFLLNLSNIFFFLSCCFTQKIRSDWKREKNIKRTCQTWCGHKRHSQR